ncbi:TonB-dependent receptor domain-containing protein [Hymenobacter terrenus]|uniref:TonB-dependent receptor domain-containing protein n=1 Tax=Hymenobacter terrenus TaxID=1629124 RepID=UPI0006193A07|nr:TonB-dependent receptor [Hymenobacter terrenus]
MKAWLILCLSVLFGGRAAAQQPAAPGPGHTVSGKVQDRASGAPIPYATINVKDAAAQPVGGGISDEQGGFRLEGIPAGELTIEFRFMGYQTVSQPLAVGGKVDIGTVSLQVDATQLAEVTVTGEKPGVSLQLDKKVFEVGKDLISQSGSANDVLGGVPSVAVTSTGAISLRGNPNVTVLINGRRSGLTQTNTLDQIPAGQIERVEVITNPSSRYDAAGSAGIVNIILKKNKQPGLGGQLRAVGGLPNDSRLNANLSYKSDKFNVFANAGLRSSDYLGRYRTNQVTNLDRRPAYLSQRQREDRHDGSRVLYLGADYYFNERNTLTAAFFKDETRDRDKTALRYDYTNAQGQADSTLQRDGTSRENRSYNQFEFNYTRLFEQPGRKYTVDVQYDYWNSTKDWTLNTLLLSPQNLARPGIRSRSIGASKDLRAQTDLVQPLSERTTLELGVKAEGRQVTSDYLAEEERDGAWAVFRGINNQLRYDELISSGYAQVASKVKSLSYQIGLRAELTRIDIADREGSFSRQKNYNRLFPTVNLSYQFKEGLTTQLSYSKRINRPSLWLLYPFNELTDLNAQQVGNPDLNPSFADVVELGLLRQWGPLTLNPSLYYQHTAGIIQTYTYRDPLGVFISTPVNLSQEVRRGLELALTYQPAKWLQLNSELNAFNFRQQGRVAEQNFDFEGQALTGRLITKFKLPAKFNLQARYDFSGAQRNAQTRVAAIHVASFGLSKNLLADKATLSLDGSNIFNTNQTRTQTTGEDFVFNQVNNRNAARYRLGFVYRFNLKEGQAIRQAKSSNRD